MYAETFPQLKAKYDVDNFEIIAQALDKHFSDIFKLDALNSESSKEIAVGSYIELFAACMERLEGLYTVNEVVKKLHELLQSDVTIKEMVLKNLVFVPPVGPRPSIQIGFLEKMATSTLKMADPVTFIDMMRAIQGLEHLKKNSFGSHFPSISVVHLGDLPALDADTLKYTHQALIVNFNRDLKGAPKWGVVNLTDVDNPVVYCETALTEREKRELEAGLSVNINRFIDSGANSLPSTGYTALAWLDNKITKAWNFDVNADFAALVQHYNFVQTGGDSSSLTFRMKEREVDEFCTPAFRRIASNSFSDIGYSSDITSNAFTGGRALVMLSYAAALGKLAGHTFRPGDIAAAIQISETEGWTNPDIKPFFNKSLSTLPPGFSKTILRNTDPILLTESADGTTISLNVPGYIDIYELERAHDAVCRETGTNSSLLRKIPYDVPRAGTEEEYMAVMMVLTLIRAMAKKRILEINLPTHFNLNRDEKEFVIATLSENAYITEFKVNNNASLEEIRTQLIPTFARNRWLAESGYRPPMIDDYWKQAAKHWLLHLRNQPDLLQPSEGNKFFKRCVAEMGLMGLQAVLALLKDENERELIERVYGLYQPAFYAAYQAHEVRPYLQALITHLRTGSYFPFSELGISYQPANDRAFIELLVEIDNLKRFDKITLTDCLDDKVAFKAFLTQLTRYALDYNWVGLIVIPELEQKENIAEDVRELRAIYLQLNNVILHNRHLQAAQKLIKSIKETSDFADTVPAMDDGAAVDHDAPGDEEKIAADDGPDGLERVIGRALDSLDPDASWPLKKGGVVQLQLQQQQQIQQTRQVQQQQQKVRAQVLEEAISGQLVDYNNIDRLLEKYFDEFRRENKIYDNCATLKFADETLLQGLFHTWVNANPKVEARQVIHQMTLDAAKALLRKHRILSSGLNPDNLPKGFFTQRSKDGHLILCYSPELAYVTTPNALTIDLDTRLPEAEFWEGDFRQFDLRKYLGEVGPIDQLDWQYMILFAQLQPVKNYSDDFETFCAQNPRVASVAGFADQRAKIIKNWRVFLQAWQYAGMDGVKAFLAKPAASLTLPLSAAREILLRKQSDQLQDWVGSVGATFDEDYLRALGQVYYRYGDEGVAVLLAKFRQIDMNLGRAFYEQYTRHVVKASKNFNCFMSEAFFSTMDEMIRNLRPAAAEGNKRVWQTIMARHMYSIGWENIEKLWLGFDYFLAELAQMGLRLEGHEFDEIDPENMLVAMDRILESLRHIPQLEKQQSFLLTMARMDRTHGGVHYALQHEGFKYFNAELELYGFVREQTYAPDLMEIYSWSDAEASIKMKRALASKARFSFEAYNVLSERLGNDRVESRHQLMWLLHLQYPATDIDATLAMMDRVDPAIFAMVAEHLHEVVYRLGHSNIAVNLEAMVEFSAFIRARPELGISHLIQHYSHGTLLEAVSILWQSKRSSPASLEQLIALFAARTRKEAGYSEYFYREGYKLATLLGASDEARLQAFYLATKGARPVVQNELRLLITQLFSVDYNPETSNLAALSDPANWDSLLHCIEEMSANPTMTAEKRIAFIEELSTKGIVFKYSKRGEFRALNATEEDRPEGLGFFVDHEDRLLEFMRAHIAVPVEGDAQDALQPIVRFLKVLQLNRTYLNEIEPLLATLEQTKPGLYWSASYFYGLLRALQPDDNKTSFPISLLKVMLQEALIGAKELDGVQKDFPQELATTLQIILKNRTFNRNEQSLLCQIALREFNWQNSSELLTRIMTTLAADGFANGRGYALEILARCKSTVELAHQFENCRWLLQSQSTEPVVVRHWTKTSALWLKALSARQSEEALFAKIQSGTIASDPEKQALILHIVAWSSLYPGLKGTEAYEYELDKKAPKLADRLGDMETADLIKIATCYPHQPSPSADDLVRMMKKRKRDDAQDWDGLLDAFMRKPYPEPRADYGAVALTRDADLQRMLALTQISRGHQRRPLSTEHTAELTLIFSYLKRLENGEMKVAGSNKAIYEMNQEELAAAFKRLSEASTARPHDDLLRSQVWAVLFEVLARTTRKYPHLAQQFALIANDVCIDANSRVLQLATGEGKSHFVALRAARHAGLGKTVDVCTAKRTLAERDLEDYDGMFQYLGLTTAYIHPKSTRDTYVNSQIRYSTTGDLSLFLDEQSYSGQPIEIDPAKRVVLIDEFDFVLYDEGRKTQYNYARPTGKTPKQMTWFYQVVNDFYTQGKERGLINVSVLRPINQNVLAAFTQTLLHEVGDNEEKQAIVASLLRDPLQLVQWLQSAHEAHELEWGVGFTVRDEFIQVGEESYPMREIIPLSSDNQKMVGSTFSAGVQQLLAVRLNKEAKANHEPQNFHIHPESHIISSQVASQRMQQLWGRWEGFSGTISAAQATELHTEQGTEVLHVPTNQLDLRHWHKPLFFASSVVGKTDVDKRLDAIVKQIRICLEKKQSILFSCRNDKQVTELEEQLRGRLNEAELANFIFYTNEDKRSPGDVLDDKRGQESWRGGKKQHGVVLVASGFGRGDNVGVEAVFLLDVNDTNDMLQKGGRTARNGEEGEVFRFFLNKDLETDEAYLRAVLEASAADVNMVDIDNELEEIPAGDANARRFESVMLLREYVFSLQNAANQGYHHATAQLSSWGMKLLGAVSDPTLRHNSMLNFSSRLKRLEKRWIQVSSDPGMGVANKIEAIEQAIMAESEVFAERYAAALGEGADVEVTPFALAERRATETKLVVTAVPKLTPRDRAIASICSVLTRLSDLKLDDPRVAQIPEYLAALAGDEHLEHDGSGEAIDLVSFHTMRLQKFAEQITYCKSVKQFVDSLEIAAEQAANPSKTLKEARDAVGNGIDASNLFNEVSDSVRVQFDKAIEQLLPGLQEQLMMFLCSNSWLSGTGRIEQVLPIVEHLGKFSPADQQMWGEEYIEQMGHLLHEMPADLLALRFKHSKPMSVRQFDALWHVARRYSADNSQLVAHLSFLGDVIEPDPEQRLRLLTKWEAWSRGMNTEQAGSFLTSFSSVMQGFEEGLDWDIFVSLVNKTNDWWNKGGESKYQGDLLSLWHQLSAKGAMKPVAVPVLNQFVKWGVSFAGKEWYQLLMRSLVLPVEQLETHQKQIESLWTELEQTKGKKSEKLQRYSDCLNGLQVFYRLPEERISALKGPLLNLGGDRFIRTMTMMHEHSALLIERPELAAVMVDIMEDNTLSTEQIEQFSERFARGMRMMSGHNALLTERPEVVTAIVDLIKDKTLAQEQFDQLAERFDRLMEVMQANRVLLNAMPGFVTAILGYMKDKTLTNTQVNQLAEVLLYAAKYQQSEHGTGRLERLLAGVDAYKADSEGLSILLELYGKEPTFIEEPLFDGIVEHLKGHDDAAVRSQVADMAMLFYSAVRESDGDLVNMTQRASIKAMFQFHNNSEAVRNQRILFMHLLNKRVFETGGLPAQKGEYQWSKSWNDYLLNHGFKAYVQDTQAILEQPRIAQPQMKRDLTVSQQRGLLKLTDELSLIGSRAPRVAHNTFLLKLDLADLQANYQGSWFKSRERVEQANQLGQTVTSILSSPNEGMEQTRYQSVLEAIHAAKIAAMESDLIQNRSRWFKINRSGKSRYFETLTKMQDMVLRHWTNDVGNILQFQEYQKYHHREFNDLVVCLQTAVQQQMAEIQLRADYVRDRSLLRGWDSFFGHGPELTAKLEPLHRLLSELTQRDGKASLTSAEVRGLMDHLRRDVSKLPGHLVTLANELLERGVALEKHLDEQADFIRSGSYSLGGVPA